MIGVFSWSSFYNNKRNQMPGIVETTPVVEKVWRPNTGKQELYLSLPDSIFEQFYGGAAGGGKSEALLMRPVLRQWTDISGFKALILRRTYRELEESLIQRSATGRMQADGTEMPTFRDFGAVYNEQKKRWKFPSGATITFGHAEEEADVKKYDTAEYQYIGFDELTSFTEFQYKFLAFSRCRSSIPGIPALVCSASNPGNVGHRWVRERFVEPARNGGKILAERLDGQLIKRIFIQAFLTDNPRLMENDPLYKARLEMLPEADKRAKLYGDWWTFSGQVFGEFRTEPFIGEPQNACHIVPSFIPDPRLPRVLAIDWGYQAMTYCLWAVPIGTKSGRNKCIIYKEFTPNPTNATDKEVVGELDSKTVQSWTTAVANECLIEGINPWVVLDPSAWQNRGNGTIEEQFRKTWKEVTGTSPRLEKADNDRLSGKMLIHDYLRWRPRPKYNILPSAEFDKTLADWIFRNKGLQAYNSYLSQFDPKSDLIEEDLPRLQITSNCRILIKTLPICVYSEKDNNIEDVKEFRGDDPYDDTRYLLKKIDSMRVDELPTPPVETAMKSGNPQEITNFYRRMEVLESKKKSAPFIMMGRRSGRRRH